MISFSELSKKLTEGVMQPNGTDKVDYDLGMDGNPQNPDKKNKKSKGNGDVKILNGEQEPPIKESDAAWAAAEEKRREKEKLARISDKDKNTLSKLSAMMAKEKKPMKEAMYVEQSRAESGELFKSLVDRAHAASERGDHTQAKRHLANAQTARYGITSGNMAKHKKSFDKYKELKNSYTNSDDHVREDYHLDEAHKINDRVEIIKGSAKGTVGRIGEIRHGAFKGAAKTYTVYHGENDATQVPKEHIRKLKEQDAVMPCYTKEDLDEAIDKEHPIYKEYQSLKKKSIEDLRDHIKSQHRIIDTSEFRSKEHAVSHILHNKHGERRMKAVFGESLEQINEISKDTLNSYVHKAFAQGNDLHYDIDHTSDKDEKAKLKAKLSKRNDGVIKAAQKLRKEDMDEAIDHQHRIARDTVKNPNKSLLGGPSAKEAEETLRKKYGYDDKKIAKLKEAVDTVKKDASGKVIAWSHEGDWEKMSTKKQGQGKAANLAGRALQQTKKLTKEEKDEGEYGYEGDMAISQLKTICRHAEHLMGMLKPDTDLPEWVQSKITLATDYMQTAHDYMMSEINESLDEAAHVYDTKTGKVHSTHDTYRKAINAMNKLNDKHPGYDTPGGLVQSKFGAKRVNEEVDLEEKGLWDNIHAKRKRIAAGSGEKMRKPGSKGAPSAQDLKDAQVKEDINESAWGRDKMTSLRQAHDRHMEKALAANKAGDDVAVKTHQRKMQMIQGKMQKLKQNEEVELGEECEILLGEAAHTDVAAVRAKYKQNEDDNRHTENAELLAKHFGSKSDQNKVAKAKAYRDRNGGYSGDAEGRMHSNLAHEVHSKLYHHIKESVEELDELSKNTLGMYVKKASRDQSHKTALAQAYSQHDLGKTIDMDRIANRRKKGIDKAVDKLTKEEVEEFMQTEAYDQLDELSKDTLKSYVNKSAQSARIQGMMQMDYGTRSKKAKSPGMKNAWDKMSRDAMKKGWKREDGIKMAVNKLTKEDNMLSYSEFMAQLLEGRADDLKDKLAADREARLNNYDYSKEKAAKKSPVQKVKGHSYGAGEEEGEDDEDTTKTVKPASEKRGRGRPAGSKSGARV